MSELPFSCPSCGAEFGFGGPDQSALLGVVRSLPFTAAPAPCCGVLLTGQVIRDAYDDLILQVEKCEARQ